MNNLVITLPYEERNKFLSMNDRLYVYLFSIAQDDINKQFKYIYLSKGKDGSDKYDAKAAMKYLNLPTTTYYRYFNTLQKLELVTKITYNDRKTLKIVPTQGKYTLDLKTCLYLSKIQQDDIIKILFLLKICFYETDKKIFTLSQLKEKLGYSVHHTNSNEHIYSMLNTLKELNIIDFEIIDKNKKGCVEYTLYKINKIDDSYRIDFMIS